MIISNIIIVKIIKIIVTILLNILSQPPYSHLLPRWVGMALSRGFTKLKQATIFHLPTTSHFSQIWPQSQIWIILPISRRVREVKRKWPGMMNEVKAIEIEIFIQSKQVVAVVKNKLEEIRRADRSIQSGLGRRRVWGFLEGEGKARRYRRIWCWVTWSTVDCALAGKRLICPSLPPSNNLSRREEPSQLQQGSAKPILALTPSHTCCLCTLRSVK